MSPLWNGLADGALILLGVVVGGFALGTGSSFGGAMVLGSIVAGFTAIGVYEFETPKSQDELDQETLDLGEDPQATAKEKADAAAIRSRQAQALLSGKGSAG